EFLLLAREHRALEHRPVPPAPLDAVEGAGRLDEEVDGAEAGGAVDADGAIGAVVRVLAELLEVEAQLVGVGPDGDGAVPGHAQPSTGAELERGVEATGHLLEHV